MGKYRPIIVTADCGSLTRAGKILGYAQPNMGSIVTRIENELGVKLFHRNQHGVTLTKTGERLVDIMRQIDDMESYLHEVSTRTRTERFRVGVFQSDSSQWLPSTIADFRLKNPDTVFHIEYLGCNLEGEVGVQERSLDCAFFQGSNIPEGIQHIPLIREPIYLLVPSDSPLALARSISLSEVAGKYPYIHTNEVFDEEQTCKDIWQKLMERNVIKLHTPEITTILSLVSQGMGICLVPKLSLSGVTSTHKVKAIPLTDAISRTVGLIFSKKTENPVLVNLFAKLLQRRAEELVNTQVGSLYI